MPRQATATAALLVGCSRDAYARTVRPHLYVSWFHIEVVDVLVDD
jgi:hypothetical protein